MSLRDPGILEHTLGTDERAVLDDLVSRLRANFGDRVARIAVFGSRARGDVTGESDIDLLIVLKIPTEAEETATNDVWNLLRLARERAPRIHVPLAPAVFSEEHFEKLRRRERRFALDTDAEGIPL